MEGVAAAAHEFLADGSATEAALQVDRRRRSELGELRDAFIDFRDADEALTRLAERLAPGLQAEHAGVNLWGFANEEERVFGSRFAEAGSRLPEVDLPSVFRSYILDTPQDDEERIQLLLAFSEFVASLDARGGDDDPRLGVGPAANFLTFAWHCLSSGKEPVFSFSNMRAIRALADDGGLGRNAPVRGDLESRYRTFYRVARMLQRELTGAPKIMRAGWAVEHALAWMLDRSGTAAAAAGDDFGRSGMWQPRDRAELRAALEGGGPVIEAPRSHGDSGIRIDPPRRASDPEPDLTPASAQRRDRFMDIARQRTTQPSDSGKIVDITGMSLEDALPPDRSTDDVPFFARESPRAKEIEAEEDARRELTKKADTRRIKRKRAAEEYAAAQPRVEAPVPPQPKAHEPPAPPPPAPPPPVTASPETAVLKRPRTVMEPTARQDSGRMTALLNEFRGEVIQTSQGGEVSSPASDRLARDLYLDFGRWGALLDALSQQGAALLAGPAAAGKTYVARRVALHLAGREERVLFLRFHPELTYDSLLGDRQGRGLVRNLCDRALEDREHTYVIVLDELDRGDAARALGEFLGGMSERGQQVRLANGDSFAVPRNVRVIATARGLPHDPALLGRFPVIRWPADPKVLRRFLAHRRPGCEQVADLFAALLAALKRRDLAGAVGHGLLMDPELEVTNVRGRWEREVLPLLEAQGIDPAGLGYDDLR